MSGTLGYDEIQAAVGVAQSLGWYIRVGNTPGATPLQAVPSLQMEQVLRAAYDCPTGQPAELRALSLARAELEHSIAERRVQLAELRAERDTLEGQLAGTRHEMRDVVKPARLLKKVRRLVNDLQAAGWDVPVDAYNDLKRLSEEGECEI